MNLLFGRVVYRKRRSIAGASLDILARVGVLAVSTRRMQSRGG
jgi:hypothetical protein